MHAYTSQLVVGVLLVAILSAFVWYVRTGHDRGGALTELYVMGAPEYEGNEGVFLTYAVRNRTGNDHTYGVRADIALADVEYTTVFAKDVFVRNGEVRVLRDFFPYDSTATSTIRIEIPDFRQFIQITVPPPQ